MKMIFAVGAVALSQAVFTQAQNQVATPTPPPDTTVRSSGERLSQKVANVFKSWKLEELPPAVQKTVREQAGAAKIDDIDREDRTGRTIWEIEIERDGKDTEIHVFDDGTLVPEADRNVLGATRNRNALDSATSGEVKAFGEKWEELPSAVQQKASAFGSKESVRDIDRETRDNKVVYEIEFEREGKNLEMVFAEDGMLLESNDPNATPGLKRGLGGSQPAQTGTGQEIRRESDKAPVNQPKP